MRIRSSFIACCALFLFTVTLPVFAACCKCVAAGKSDTICLKADSGTCESIVTDAKNPALKNVTCDKTPLSPTACAPIGNAGSPGVCKTGPVDASVFVPGAIVEKTTIALIPPKLNVPIPGLTFSSIAIDEGGSYQIPFLAQYIAGVYRYLLTVTLIAAAVMVVYGGFKYLLSASVAEIQGGKEIMQNAIIGLILVFGVYAILATVNPQTLNLAGIRIVKINKIEKALEKVNVGLPPIPGEPQGDYSKAPPNTASTGSASSPPLSTSDGLPAAAPGTTCDMTKGFPDFKQSGGTWGSKPLGSKPACTGKDRETYGDTGSAPCCMYYGDSACGPTSLADVLAAYGESVDPGIIGQIAVAAGLRNCNTGGISPGSGVFFQRYPDYELVPKFDKKDLDATLKSGHPVIFLCSGCTVGNKKNNTTYKFGGHYMVLTGVYADGNYAIVDPSRFNGNYITKDEVDAGRAGLIYVRRKDSKPIKACK